MNDNNIRMLSAGAPSVLGKLYRIDDKDGAQTTHNLHYDTSYSGAPATRILSQASTTIYRSHIY